MRHSKSRGFTLVELLVVISIIGMLVSLLLPAVQQARERGRAMVCSNNLHNLSLAMKNFDSSQNRLPGYINTLGADPDKFGERLRASWVTMILPQMEESTLYDRWNQSHLPVVQHVDSFNCPSDPSQFEGDPTLSYVVNTGQHIDTTDGAVTDYENGANGLFFDNSQLGPDTYPDPSVDPRQRLRKMSMAYVEQNDGATRTMMISENVFTLFWAYDDLGFVSPSPGQPLQAPGCVDSDGSLTDRQYYYGFLWRRDDSPTLQLQVNGALASVDRINGARAADVVPETMGNMTAAYGYPSSQHPGGVHVAFCGGNVQFIRENIDSQLYRQLMTTKDKTSDNDTKGSLVDGSQL